MEMLASDRNLYNEISAKAREFIRNNYDNNVIATRLLDFYKEAVER
jgi:glycosyltransferase involved in cell wall biosynthesis